MLFTVQVKVMPLKELLDPQGKAVMGGLGKEASKKLLANAVMEYFEISVE
jgi:phosphoribosylformylglycinamidine synthase